MRGALRRRIDRTLEHLTPRQAWPTWVLSNHDVPRHRQRYGGSEAIARQAAVLLLTLPGTPFLYQGEELGLIDAVVPDDRIVDPGGRDGCRAPIPWTAAADHGWGPSAVAAVPARGVRAQRRATDRRSRLDRPPLPAHARAQAVEPALHSGGFRWLEAPDDVLAYERSDGATGERAWVVINMGPADRQLTLPGPGTIVLSTDQRDEGAAATGAIRGMVAHVVRPA